MNLQQILLLISGRNQKHILKTYFCGFYRADYNRLYNYKISRFTAFERGCGKGGTVCGGGRGGGGGAVLRLSFERSKGGCYQS